MCFPEKKIIEIRFRKSRKIIRSERKGLKDQQERNDKVRRGQEGGSEEGDGRRGECGGHGERARESAGGGATGWLQRERGGEE